MTRSKRWKKSFFCPLPCLMIGRVATGRLICTVNMTHVMVIICHNWQLIRIPVFIMIIAFSGWIVDVCQEKHVSLVLPHHNCQVTPGPYSNVTMFQSLCLGFEVLGHALSMQPHCLTTGNFFLGQVVKKMSMYSLWPNPTHLVRLDTCVWVALRCCATLCLYQGKHSRHMYVQ